MVWIDDLIIQDSSQGESVSSPARRDVGQASQHRLVRCCARVQFFELMAKRWCKIYSGQGTGHDPDRVRGLIDMRCPESVGKLMKFQAGFELDAVASVAVCQGCSLPSSFAGWTHGAHLRYKAGGITVNTQ